MGGTGHDSGPRYGLDANRVAVLSRILRTLSATAGGDVVLSSDVGDLERLRAYFPGVRVLGV